MEQLLVEIYDLLYRLGPTANYIGFFHTSYAVLLCVQQPERLLLVTKWLYPDVAKRYGTNWRAVERNIRTAGSVIWRENRPLLEELARRPLLEKPRPAQLLAILASSLDAGPLSVHGLGEAITPTGKKNDAGVVDEPVNAYSGKTVIAKDVVPLAELQVGDDHKAFPFIAV